MPAHYCLRYGQYPLAALPPADLVIVGIGFPDDIHGQPAAMIIRMTGAPTSYVLDQVTSAITGAWGNRGHVRRRLRGPTVRSLGLGPLNHL
ncbi:hypothetical protein [Aeromicrobium sp. UC242_57]|uniref:hypothetical protein n=1 Tax=Aeromicrobium sp. UC242_57 TaxID=3374624 RepID=UPI0037BA8BE5